MPKNIPRAPSMCPASRFQAVSGLSRSSRSRFLVLYRSFVRSRPASRGSACAKYRVLAHPQIVRCYLSDGLWLKNPRRSRVCVCVCTYMRVNAFDVSYTKLSIECNWIADINRWNPGYPTRPGLFSVFRRVTHKTGRVIHFASEL